MLLILDVYIKFIILWIYGIIGDFEIINILLFYDVEVCFWDNDFFIFIYRLLLFLWLLKINFIWNNLKFRIVFIYDDIFFWFYRVCMFNWYEVVNVIMKKVSICCSGRYC